MESFSVQIQMIFISWLCFVPQSGVAISLLLYIFGSGSSEKLFQILFTSVLLYILTFVNKIHNCK